MTSIPDWFIILRAILEILYFTSGIVLAIAGLFALKQLRIAKSDIKLRAQREAASLAAQQSEKFTESLMPLVNELKQHWLSKGLLEPKTGGIRPAQRATFIELSLSPEDERRYVERFLVAPEICTTLLNGLESFAIYFVKGVADEEVAFYSQGLEFCHLVEELEGVLIKARKGGHGIKPFQAIIDLYN
jgi:hypothetical protein